MELQPTKLEAVKEEEWEFITTNWWYTPFTSVLWSYPGGNQTGARPGYLKPPHYHESLFTTPVTRSISPNASLKSDEDCNGSDVLLNPALVGVSSATEALSLYETDVGFHDLDYPLEQVQELDKFDLSVPIPADKVTESRSCWDGLVEKLFDGLMDCVGSFNGYAGKSSGLGNFGLASSTTGLNWSTSTTGSLDLTDSDPSSSPPSTPKVKGVESNVNVVSDSPTSEYFSAASSPTRPLNASASSFIPSFLKLGMDPIPFPSLKKVASPSTPPVDFVFPSLDASSSPTVKIKKDEHGFYSEIEVLPPAPPLRPSSALLPPFLQERRRAPVSKTRAMVERLRSSNQFQDATHSPSPSPPFYNLTFPKERIYASDEGGGRDSGVSSPSTAIDEDEDGWINLADGPSVSKAKRTRDLFLALTRRRSDSLPARRPVEYAETPDDTTGVIATISPPSPPSPPPAMLSTTTDGWIEGSITPPKVTPRPRTDSRSRQNRRRRSSNIPTLPHFAFTLPANTGSLVGVHPAQTLYPQASYFYPTYPSVVTPMAYASFMQLQHQVQMQMSRADSNVLSGGWFSRMAPTQMAPTKPFVSSSLAMSGSDRNAVQNGSHW